MRRLALFCLGPGLVSAASASVIGPPLPTPYQFRHVLTAGQTQVILATAGRVVDSPVIPGDKTLEVTSLLLARDVRSGRTVWKRYLGDQYELEAVSPTAIGVTHVQGPRKWASWYLLRDGKFVGRAVMVTPTALP